MLMQAALNLLPAAEDTFSVSQEDTRCIYQAKQNTHTPLYTHKYPQSTYEVYSKGREKKRSVVTYENFTSRMAIQPCHIRNEGTLGYY